MRISLDTNVWIFGLISADESCDRILSNLNQFEVLVPDQVREELQRNLGVNDIKIFYRYLKRYDVVIDFELVPLEVIRKFEQQGLKKGDAEMGAFCEWRSVDVFVSDNRDFLKALPANQVFRVMPPERFCQQFKL